MAKKKFYRKRSKASGMKESVAAKRREIHAMLDQAGVPRTIGTSKLGLKKRLKIWEEEYDVPSDR